MGEGSTPEAEDGAQGEGAGVLPGMEAPSPLLSAAPRSSISFVDPHKKWFF